MKKVLMLGGIAPFCDLIETAKEKEIDCIVCDYYEDAPAKKRVNKAYNISTTEVEEMIRVAEENDVQGVITAYSDRNLLPALAVAQKLDLPTMYTEDIISLLTDKIKMKERLMQNDVPVIPYKIIHRGFKEEDLASLIFPVVTKPIDAYGSKGIYVCQTVDDVRDKFDLTAKEALQYKDEIIVEEFYPVDEISISGWVDEGQVYVTCMYDVVKNYENGIELAAVDFPSKYTDDYLDRFRELFQKVADIFEINEGPVTLQCFIGDRGVKVSELLFRLAGGSPYLYANYLGGPDVGKMWIEKCIGAPADLQNLKSFVPRSMDRLFDVQLFVTESAKMKFGFQKAEILEKIPECADVRQYFFDGDEIMNVPRTGKMVLRLICRLRECTDEKYLELLDRIEKNVVVYDENMKKISMVRRPEALRCNKMYVI